MSRITLRDACDAIGKVLDPVASYHGGEIRVDVGSHATALKIMREARQALVTMRAVEAGNSPHDE